jgi:hypothetical protein
LHAINDATFFTIETLIAGLCAIALSRNPKKLETALFEATHNDGLAMLSSDMQERYRSIVEKLYNNSLIRLFFEEGETHDNSQGQKHILFTRYSA